MFGSTMLDTMLGMIYVFVAASLGVTAANELIASFLRWRARDLEHGIERLLHQPADALFDDAPESKKRISSPSASATLFTQFKGHALIQSLARKRDLFPSYISARTFAMVLLDLAQLRAGATATAAEMRRAVDENGTLPPHLKRVFDVLLTQVENDLREGMSDFAKLQEGVERWFDSAMDRVAGWYRRRSQWVNFGLALALAVSMNVDSIDIVQTLSRDTTLRQSIAAQAAQLAQKAPPPPRAPRPEDTMTDTVQSYEALADAVANIDGLGLPLGWKRQIGTIKSLRGGGAAFCWWLTKVGGLLLTALAASLGAPFWFDLLNRIVSIRAAGKAPKDDVPAPKSKPGGGGPVSG